MTREFIRLQIFEKQCKNIGVTEDDIKEIESILLTNPTIGDVIQDTNGIRKFRIALNGKGKSGGARVIYINFAYYGKIYLINIYAKNIIENLSKSERNELKALVKILENELERKKCDE